MTLQRLDGLSSSTDAMVKAKHKAACPYCGREKAGTLEHVIPRTLFRVSDPDMPTAYICYQCNQGMSAAIRDLRTMIALHIGSSGHPDIEFHLRKIFDTNEATRAWLQRVLEQAESVDYVTDEGEVVGTALRFEFNQERARRALAAIVRGLYYIETGNPLPRETPVSVIELDVRIAETFAQRLMRHDHIPPTEKGNDVARWVPFLALAEAGPDSTAWLLTFLGGV